jgi:hypothetical protein
MKSKCWDSEKGEWLSELQFAISGTGELLLFRDVGDGLGGHWMYIQDWNEQKDRYKVYHSTGRKDVDKKEIFEEHRVKCINKATKYYGWVGTVQHLDVLEHCWCVYWDDKDPMSEDGITSLWIIDNDIKIIGHVEDTK